MRIRLLMSLLILITASRCDPPANDTVTIPASDGTPPRVALDAFLNTGTVSVASSGSAATASVGNQGQISLIASTTDDDGGAQDIQIWVETTTTSCTADGTCSQRGPGLLGGPAVSNPDSPKTPGSSASKSRLANYTLDIAALRGTNTTSITVRIWAIGSNFHGGQVQTPNLVLTWP
jgi:hypothetical protein